MLKEIKINLVRKSLSIFLIMLMITFMIPVSASARVDMPDSFGAPEHFAVSHYYVDSVNYTFGASEDMRDYIDRLYADNPDAKIFSPYFQVDYKIDDGPWQYTSEWDSPETVPAGLKYRYLTFASGEYYISSERDAMSSYFPDNEELKLFKEQGWDYLKSHSITYRVRIAQPDGSRFILSPWSKEYVLSASSVKDYNKMINHAPKLLSTEIKYRGDEPYFRIKTDRIAGEVQDLHAMSFASVYIELWVREEGQKEFRKLDSTYWFQEKIDVDASDFFKDNIENYEEAGYEVKARYILDLRSYKQSGYNTGTVYIYSPFSNVISHNMPAWSEASSWATGELKKAEDMGLIPDMLKGADMTKPITRREFAAVSVKLYEKLSGNTAAPIAVNPFKDTNDIEVLKAYNVGVTDGVSADKFDPDKILNREQAATMLTRVFKKTFVKSWSLKDDKNFEFKYTMPPKFADDAKISDWAKPSVYFMNSHGIISGVGNNNFEPRAITSAEQASNYASATREQSLIIAMRMTENLDETDANEIVPAVQGDDKQVSEVQNGSIVGRWQTGSLTGHEYSAITGTFKYNSGIGMLYVFNGDGSFSSLIVSGYGNSISISGSYKIDGDKIVFTNKVGKSSTDYAKTWGESKKLADETVYFSLEAGDKDRYLLMGLPDAKPPLDIETNAVSYISMEE